MNSTIIKEIEVTRRIEHQTKRKHSSQNHLSKKVRAVLKPSPLSEHFRDEQIFYGGGLD